MNNSELSELYGFQTSNCLRAAIALEEGGIAYRPRVVDLRRGDHRMADFLKLNPMGQLPVFIDRTRQTPLVLTQSNAIVFHAADLSGNALMSKTDPRLRALTYERYFFFLTDVIAPHHASAHVRGMSGSMASRTLGERALMAMMFAEDFVSTMPYMAGDAFSIADIAAFTVAHTLASQINWAQLPNLKRWYFEVAQRPAIVRGFTAFRLEEALAGEARATKA